jgi:hypothetical protein
MSPLKLKEEMKRSWKNLLKVHNFFDKGRSSPFKGIGSADGGRDHQGKAGSGAQGSDKKGVDQVASVLVGNVTTHCNLELLVGVQEIVAATVAYLGKYPEQVIDLLVGINKGNAHLVFAAVSASAVVGWVGVRGSKIKDLAAQSVGYGERKLAQVPIGTRIFGFRDYSSQDLAGALGLFQAFVNCFLAFLGRKQPGREDSISKDRCHDDEGDQNNGGFQPGDTFLLTQ